MERFLSHADVAEAVFMLIDSSDSSSSSSSSEEDIKRALFGCLRRYSTNGTIVNR